MNDNFKWVSGVLKLSPFHPLPGSAGPGLSLGHYAPPGLIITASPFIHMPMGTIIIGLRQKRPGETLEKGDKLH
ncbi:MAG: hypothetical protein JEZ12_11815 [Desulfobacterium sp.]|nr:hypothetical protein [Desulfobacterium sp.]